MPGPNKPGVNWTEIEACVRAGEAMGSVARRIGVSRQAISKRAKKEGWSSTADAEVIAATDTARRLARPATGADRRLVAEGRRSPATMQRVLDMLATGASVAMAARRVGMSPDALHDWFRADVEFKRAAEAAGADFGAGLVERIAEACKRGDWRADAHLLERHPATRDEFGQRAAATGQGAGPILIQINAPGFTGGAYGEALAGRLTVTGGAAPPLPPADE